MKNISKRDKKVIWHPYTQMQTAQLPIVINRGEGAYLFDDKKNKYIDAISSWWVNIHGHAHPYIAKKVAKQLEILEHVIFAGFTHPGAVVLAERILKVLPKNQKKIFYSDNGSTAVEVALKMSFQFWYNKGLKKTKIIAFKNSYHGDTFGAMSVSGRSKFTEPFLPNLFDVIYIDAPVKGKEEESLSQLMAHIQKRKTGNKSKNDSGISEHDIAAFIFEPLVQGAAGMVMYEARELEKLVKYCKEKNVLTIADEVMTGFGRTGKFFATDYLISKPDIYCLSKGLTGGTMALGITSSTLEIYNAFLGEQYPSEKNEKLKTFFHGHSFTANPIACAAALASLDLLENPKAQKNIARIGARHETFFIENKLHPKIKELRHVGTILALELKVSGLETSYFNAVKEKASDFFLQKGIILRPLGNVIYILPPYCIKNKDLDYIYQSILDFLDTI